MNLPQTVIMEEQGLRDGLQVEKTWVATEKKLAYIQQLVAAGIKRIQVTSFVNPKLVPQMADALELCQNLPKHNDLIFSALVLNMKGLERAIAAGLSHVAISISASDAHSRRNTGMSLEQAQMEFKTMLAQAKSAGLTVRGGIQCAFGCRYQGRVLPSLVIDLAKQHLDLGVDELALADSTGMANPLIISQLMREILALSNQKPTILHLHDTEGKGMANLLAALHCGVRHFDTAFGGLGGCVFIEGATGNLATEDVAWMLAQMGIETGIDIEKIIALSEDLSQVLGKKMEAKITRKILNKITTN
jgi:hydroxymethylglutaryl-CoA lyase